MPPEGQRAGSGARPAHFRALESLYRRGADQPAVRIRRSRSPSAGVARIRFDDRPSAISTPPAPPTARIYFKMIDDAAFYACNSLVSDRFLLTTAFNLLFTKPLKAGPVIAEGRWVSGQRRVFVGEARLIDARAARKRRAAPAPSCARASRWPASPATGRHERQVMSGRLPSGVLVGAMLRRVNDAGGIGTMLARGDDQAGAILVITLEKGVNPQIWERGIGPSGAADSSGSDHKRLIILEKYWTTGNAGVPAIRIYG